MKGGNALWISTKYQCHDTVSHKIIYTDVTILFSVSMEETWINNYKSSCSLYLHTWQLTTSMQKIRGVTTYVTVTYSFSATRNQDNKYKYTYYYI